MPSENIQHALIASIHISMRRIYVRNLENLKKTTMLRAMNSIWRETGKIYPSKIETDRVRQL